MALNPYTIMTLAAVATRKSKPLKMGPLKIVDFFCIPDMMLIFHQTLSLQSLTRPYPHKDWFITFGIVMKTDRQTNMSKNIPG